MIIHSSNKHLVSAYYVSGTLLNLKNSGEQDRGAPPTPLQLPTPRAGGVKLHPCESIGQGPVRRLREHAIWVILEVKKKRPFMICGQEMVQNLGLVSAATSSYIGGGEAGQVRGHGELGSWEERGPSGGTGLHSPQRAHRRGQGSQYSRFSLSCILPRTPFGCTQLEARCKGTLSTWSMQDPAQVGKDGMDLERWTGHGQYRGIQG